MKAGQIVAAFIGGKEYEAMVLNHQADGVVSVAYLGRPQLIGTSEWRNAIDRAYLKPMTHEVVQSGGERDYYIESKDVVEIEPETVPDPIPEVVPEPKKSKKAAKAAE